MADGLEHIASKHLNVAVSRLGAELQWVRSATGHDLLWNGDGRWWSGRAPLLFPIVGELNGGACRLDGRTYRMPRHGFARRSRFERVGGGRDHVSLRLSADDETREGYPYDFVLDLSYRVEDGRMEAAATLHNSGKGALPASFGFHPAFRWPLADGQTRESHAILFDQDEPEPIRRLAADGTILPQPVVSPVRDRTLVLVDDLFTDDALVFDRIRSRGLVYGAPGGPRLRIEFPGMPYLGVWTKPGAPFLCIEPWQGLADPQGFSGDFTAKPGMVEVPAGQSRSFAMSVTLVELG